MSAPKGVPSLSRRLDLAGKRFDRWTALYFVEKTPDANGRLSGRSKWMCRCDCGTEREIFSEALVGGKASNCGCVRRLAAYPEPGKRRCITCQDIKDVSEFYWKEEKRKKSGYASRCNSCESELRKSWDVNDPRRIAGQKRSRSYYNQNRQELLEKVKAKSDKNWAGMRYRRMTREFGMTKQDFDLIFEQQGHCCAICKSVLPTRSTNERASVSWHIDHDHFTGLVRGILCSRCNPMLGMANDDPNIFLTAIEYLAKPPAKECGLTIAVPETRSKTKPKQLPEQPQPAPTSSV